ncbi:cardiolipin synthase [Bacillus sp. CGMCC 1.16541]|uniref:cardiolipin synthase n=1 Tax=Bacillus sp. CGMCC 1.16541 TaxID=2185143 RepID=UPI000D72BB0B|nr:cardiolipin synthase [Bacillus sp. CGMCC 1.16541]
MNVVTILLLFLFILNMILAITLIFLERRSISTTWAWLMVLYFIPVLGFILYLIFGQNLSKQKIFTWDQRSYLSLRESVSTQTELLRNQQFSFTNKSAERYRDLVFMHLIHNEAVLTQNNELEIFTDGHDKFNALLQDIEQATHHIHLVYYIIRSDELGKRLVNMLVQKAKEGVKVKVLYDDMGSRKFKRKLIKQLKQAGVDAAPFFPSKFPLFNLRINYRNHRKLVIIDGKIGYIGGFNIGDEYLGLNPKFGYWRDTHLKVTGMAVHYIQSRFILDWNHASASLIEYHQDYYPTISSIGKVGMQIVSSGPDSEEEQIKNGYMKMILAAKSYVYIQTPYFIPDDSLLDVLKIAALSGVDVRIMIPNKPDHPFVYWATYSHIGELLKVGAKVYIYEKGFMHAKTIVVDGQIASVGTANIDMRSFRLNFEVNAFLYDSTVTKNLTTIFEDDMKNSTLLTQEAYEQRRLLIRFKESISRLLSPIL